MINPVNWFALKVNGVDNNFVSDVYLGAITTTPVSGVGGTGAGIAGPGSILCKTNGVVYANTNTKNSPTWTAQLALGGILTGSTLALSGIITNYNGVATAGLAVPIIRAAAHLTGRTAAVASIITYTPAVDATVDVSCSMLITTSSGENFTITVSYTDTGNTPRVATLPLRILNGGNVLIVNFANGTIPYAGVLQQFRAKGGTAITIATTGTFTGCTYNVSAGLRESQL